MFNHEFASRAITAFRKCMKGRFGCGGSSHPRLRVTCTSGTDCGPCGGGNAGECNIFGSDMWYCSNTTDRCYCTQAVFHEAAHSCGIGHSPGYLIRPGCPFAGERACEIGEWFENAFQESNGGCFGSGVRRITEQEGSHDN